MSFSPERPKQSARGYLQAARPALINHHSKRERHIQSQPHTHSSIRTHTQSTTETQKHKHTEAHTLSDRHRGYLSRVKPTLHICAGQKWKEGGEKREEKEGVGRRESRNTPLPQF